MVASITLFRPILLKHPGLRMTNPLEGNLPPSSVWHSAPDFWDEWLLVLAESEQAWNRHCSSTPTQNFPAHGLVEYPSRTFSILLSPSRKHIAGVVSKVAHSTGGRRTVPLSAFCRAPGIWEVGDGLALRTVVSWLTKLASGV